MPRAFADGFRLRMRGPLPPTYNGRLEISAGNAP